MRKPSPCSCRSSLCGGRERLPVRGLDRGEHAELVAADPVDLAAVADAGGELLREPREQGVARRVAEGVVVGLEAVEVEEHEHGGGAAGERRLEVDHQLAPVPDPGQRVGLGLDARGGEEVELVAERDAHPGDHGQDRRGRQDDGGRVQALELAVDEDRERDHAEDGRHSEQPDALEPDGAELTGGLPGRRGEQEHRERPARVEDRHLVRDPADRLVEVRAVREREHGGAADDAEPRAVEAPAGEREHGDDEPEQKSVGERIRDVHRRDGRGAAGALHDGAEEDGGTERRDRERRDDCVQQEAALEVERARPHEEGDRGVEERVRGEPQPVRHRRGHGRLVPEEERVVEVPGRPQDQRHAEAGPGGLLLAGAARRAQADEGGADEEQVVEPSRRARRAPGSTTSQAT